MDTKSFLQKRAVFLFVAVLMLFSCYDPSEIHVHAYSLEWTQDAEIDLDEADILQGLFSVDENGRQVKFTKGNLYHEGSSAASGTDCSFKNILSASGLSNSALQVYKSALVKKAS